MKDLTPAAWEFLGDLSTVAGKETALAFAGAMRDRFIAELDGEPVLIEANPRQLTLSGSEQLRLDVGGQAP
jgi:hypothetical protein